MASRASASGTPSISNRILPGLTTATQNSGAPLPLPMGDAAGFDLPVGNPARLEHLESEVSEGEVGAAPCLAAAPSALLLAIFHFARHQHNLALDPCPLRCRRRRHRLPNLLRPALLLQNLAIVDPALHANHAVGGPGLRQPEVDVGAQRVQRQASLEVPLTAGDFSAVQPPATAYLDSFATEAQRRVHRLAHGAPEGDALLEL